MVKNMGGIDRILRALAGIAIIAWGVYAQNWLGAIGGVLLGTALISFCPFYPLLGINTCASKGDSAE